MGDFFAGVTGSNLTAGSDGQWTSGTAGSHPSGQFFAPVASILDGNLGTGAVWGPDVVGGPTTYRRWVEVDLGEPRSLGSWRSVMDLDGTPKVYANDAPMPAIDPLRDYTGAPYATPVSQGWTPIEGVWDETSPGDFTFTPAGGATAAFRYWALLSQEVTGGLGTSGETITEWTGVSVDTPAPDPGPIVVVYDPDDVELATLPAKNGQIRIELDDVGSGSFKINRYATEATADILKRGNFCRVTIPQIDPDPIFGFFLDEGDFTLVSSDEKGGEDLSFDGHGQLSYWARAIWLSESYLADWWPSWMGAGPPPPEAVGAIKFTAGTYKEYDVSGKTIVDSGTDTFVTGGFHAWYDQRKVFTHDTDARKATLVHIFNGAHAGLWVSPYQAGVTWVNKKNVFAFGNSVLMDSIDDGDKPGQVLKAMYDEAFATDRPINPIPLMTIDFDDTTDSNGDAWSTTDALAAVSTALGDDYLSTISKLVATGVIDVEMDVDLVMHAYNSIGTDRHSSTFATGKVRFAKGVNIADELVRELSDVPIGTFAEVLGPNDGDVGRATISVDEAPREVSIRSDSSDPAALAALGTAELNRRLLHSDSIGFNVFVPRIGDEDELTGKYLPGPPTSANGNYWPGDTITVHTGTAEQDFNETSIRLAAITIWWDDGPNMKCSVEVSSMIGGLPDTSGSSGTGSSGTVGGAGSTIPSSELFQLREERDQPDGYPSLDGDGRVDFREIETSWKMSVRVGSSANVSIGSDVIDGGTVDGTTLAEGDEVFLFGQTDASENGVYVVPDSGTAARRDDLSRGSDFLGAVLVIRDGTHAGEPWRCTNTAPPDVGTDDILWASLGTGSSSSESGITPFYIQVDETFTVPLYRQALFADPIEVDGALVVDGVLIGVD